ARLLAVANHRLGRTTGFDVFEAQLNGVVAIPAVFRLDLGHHAWARPHDGDRNDRSLLVIDASHSDLTAQQRGNSTGTIFAHGIPHSTDPPHLNPFPSAKRVSGSPRYPVWSSPPPLAASFI